MRLDKYLRDLKLPDLANKNRGYPVKSGFQINNNLFSTVCLGNIWDKLILKMYALFI